MAAKELEQGRQDVRHPWVEMISLSVQLIEDFLHLACLWFRNAGRQFKAAGIGLSDHPELKWGQARHEFW
jgi:hypothetical protein